MKINTFGFDSPKNLFKPMKNQHVYVLGHLGPSWAVLGAHWGRHGSVLGASWAVLGRLVGVLGCLGASWGRLGGVLGTLRIPRILRILENLESNNKQL